MKLTNYQLKKTTDFFHKSNYLSNKNEKYNPTSNAILDYFKFHNDKSYVSLN